MRSMELGGGFSHVLIHFFVKGDVDNDEIECTEYDSFRGTDLELRVTPSKVQTKVNEQYLRKKGSVS